MLAHPAITVPDGAPAGDGLESRRTRGGRIIVRRRGHVVWRSSGTYPDDAGRIAFGSGSLAFATYRGGVYLTDLRSPERLLVRGRSLAPLGISSDGDLIVTGGSRIRVFSRAGKLLRAYGYRARNGFAYDERSDSLFLVTPNGRLATGPPAAVVSRRRLPSSDGLIALTPGRLLVLSGDRTLIVASRAGRVVARASWPAAAGSSDSGAELSADGGAIAFRQSAAHPGDSSGTAGVYVLRAGESAARLVYRDRFGPVGCAAGASMRWRGDQLLYRRSGGRLVVIDTRTAQRRP